MWGEAGVAVWHVLVPYDRGQQPFFDMVSVWIFVWTNVLQSSFPAWIIRFGSASFKQVISISPATESRLKHTTAVFRLIKCRLENMHMLPGTDMWHTYSSSGWQEWLTNSSDKDVVMFMSLFIFPYSPVSCLFISGWRWVHCFFFLTLHHQILLPLPPPLCFRVPLFHSSHT